MECLQSLCPLGGFSLCQGHYLARVAAWLFGGVWFAWALGHVGNDFEAWPRIAAQRQESWVLARAAPLQHSPGLAHSRIFALTVVLQCCMGLAEEFARGCCCSSR